MIDQKKVTHIKTYTTPELTKQEWNSYVSSFNKVFKTNKNINYFNKKYSASSNGYSFHAFLLDENQNIIGACSLIPSYYKRNEIPLKIALAVDLFILPEYRNDSLIFLKLYLNLKKIISNDDIVAVVAVPNVNSYDYWKKVIKFHDVGNLTYWALPIRIHNVIAKLPPVLNYISLLYSKTSLILNSLFSVFYNSKEKRSNCEVVADDTFLKARFYGDYVSVIDGNITCYYCIVDEDGVKTAYLIYAKENGTTSYRAILKGVKTILKREKVDLILYIGTFKIFQFLLIRVPDLFIPKRLPLICDILKKEDKEKYKDLLDISNWDFGLMNYDVR